MAKENIAFLVNLRKNIVPDSDMFGRYYPEAESKETLSTKGFAKHVADHGGTLVSYELMQLVMAAIVKCLKEMMSQGQPVKLDGLGTFRPTVTSVTGGAASIEEALRKGVNNLVEGVNFIFIPENVQGEEITSKKFKEQCSLQFAYLVETFYKVIGGKKKSYTLRTPLSAWEVAQSDEEDNGENDSLAQTVMAPQITGTTPFAETTSVSIQAEQGAEIRYTTDGSTPTAESTLYSEAFTLSDSATVKAISIMGGQSSEVASKTFTKSSGGTPEND